MTRTAAVFLAAALLAACTDRALPTGLDPGEAQASLEVATGGSLPAALAPVEDALSRVLDELPRGKPHDDLHAALAVLADALEAEDGCAIRTSRKDAEHALRDLGRRAPQEYESDLDVVKLALESVEEPGGGRCKK